MRRHFPRAVLRAAWVLGLSLCLPAQAVTITSVTPQGEVAQVRQIAVKFSESVVPLGDLRQPDPLSLSCEGGTFAGAGRWANDRIWLYDFREALPPGTRCTLKARAEWKPIAAADPSKGGGLLTGTTEFSFNTGGPAVVSIQPSEGSVIEEDQHFLLRLNGAAVEATVLANSWCEVEGIGERLPVRVVGGAVREALLKARSTDAQQADRVLVLTCTRPLPNAAALRLVWGKGIAAQANPKIVTRAEQRLRFQVRPAFTA